MSKKQIYNTMVIDPEKGFALEDITDPPGRKWYYGKDLVALVKRNADGVLAPIELPEKMGETPEKLYRALFWDKEANILFTLVNPLLEKLKLVGMYVLIGILLFMMFLISQSL
jgi:hypothetical protein